ncbi:histidine phosphatase family protein [Sphaerotilus mobilis]|uniref:Histidine phosphatase superfamily protein (Branch 1) n=1 Tax=Sphaerotilus mobilis TaxID=47994 RepID=A0A4Q7LFZ9_9BURK|nr:histidine phosphatase family protein [Sphaerotilus mobilis]RZS52258.1 histidine phosphatase superfamily protein (branch 1) [Sphaerotilus mobilis]
MKGAPTIGPLRRRLLLGAAAVWALPLRAAPGNDLEPALRRAMSGERGAGVVLMLRHALAPGTFDPPGFRLGDCSTQRNLSDEGRRQSRQLGAWFAARDLRPSRVRSSPWCRCLETARLAFAGSASASDPVEAWPALGSPHGSDTQAQAQALAALRAGLVDVVRQGRGFEVWVTHNFVFSAFLGESSNVGDGVLLGQDGAGTPRVIARVAGLGD